MGKMMDKSMTCISLLLASIVSLVKFEKNILNEDDQIVTDLLN